MDYKRYAIYHAPEGALADAGAEWLGWDAQAGRAVVQPVLNGLPRPLADLTQAPRKYGLHATIKAPFRLAAGCSPEGLCGGLDELARQLAPVALEGLEIAPLGTFLALRPVGDQRALRAMAAEVVSGLDRFRAPLTDAEIARRKPDQLSPRQRALLDRYGYPYVLEELHLHLTLSDSLESPMLEALQPIAAHWFARHLTRPHLICDLCLFGEAADGRFHLIHRAPLSG